MKIISSRIGDSGFMRNSASGSGNNSGIINSLSWWQLVEVVVGNDGTCTSCNGGGSNIKFQ
jgi:hypothetical protein